MALMNTGDKPKFAHPSEAEFAQILDYYQIRWEYEPHTFVIGEDEAFSPDFFLPDFNLHIELTTAKQALIGYKRRKVRLLKERHPEINIKLLTLKDVEALFLKYGRKRVELGCGDAEKNLSEEGSLADFDEDSPHDPTASTVPTNLATHQDRLEQTEP